MTAGPELVGEKRLRLIASLGQKRTTRPISNHSQDFVTEKGPGDRWGCDGERREQLALGRTEGSLAGVPISSLPPPWDHQEESPVDWRTVEHCPRSGGETGAEMGIRDESSVVYYLKAARRGEQRSTSK
ncbi:hypothetical protein NDU88_007336 [Pleurodeles waltl]|uniref:Uncharacterized protein n=1 Tax=Pleurodeles waltl TaxID=8319 RepID=A0AAV7RRH2_PLEWA|nr:hypothetical protein NDU88_007336 [Pleurodeles waltl]